jgi:hypothetical protein
MRSLVTAVVVALAGCSAPPAGSNGNGDGGSNDDPYALDGGVGSMPDGSSVPDLPDNDFFPPRPSPIAAENQRPGSSGWQLTLPSSGLEAYLDAYGVLPGATVHVHAAGAAASTATWELWRLGYYGGARGRLVASGGPVAVPAATPPQIDPTTGMITAGWPATFAVTVPDDAVTGYYLVKLSTSQAQTYAPLIVREATPGAPVLVDVAIDTWQAYNAWGGTSLYDNSRTDWSAQHAYAVSFDRPFQQGNGAGQLFWSDRDFITFAEAQGYDIGYVTDEDLDRDVQLLARRRFAVVQGHSEYWTGTQRAHVEAALAAGTNLAFLGANDIYWQVRWSDDRRSLIGYKEYCVKDPLMASAPEQASCRYRDLQTPRPENALVGVMFGEWQLTAAPFRISDAGAWLWTGSGATTGALIPGLFGFESDRRYANGAEPAGLTEIGAAAVENHQAQISVAQSTMYTAPSGATVFAAASTDWSRMLAADGMWDRRVQQATANLFAWFAGDGKVGAAALEPFVLGPPPPAPSYRGGVTVSTVTTALTQPVAVTAAANGDAIVADGNRIVRVTPAGAVSVIAGTTVAGFADGPAASAAFAGPRGVAVRSDGGIYVSDSSNHKIRLILGGTVSTVAGIAEGFCDGSPSVAKFDTPMTIAMHPSGVLLVADEWNHRIRAVDATGRVSTWAGDGSVNVKDGPGAQAEFWFPFTLAVRGDGSTVIVDAATGMVRLMANDSVHTISTLAGQLGLPGWSDGPTATASVMEILAVAARASGETVLVDGATWRVRGLRGGVIDTLAGGATSALVDGAGAQAGFQLPRAVAAAPDDSILVADTGNHALRRIVAP